jgi:hypothetical protein
MRERSPSLINALCRDACVNRVGNDLMLKKVAEMDVKWLEKLSDAPPKAPRRPPVKKTREVDDEPVTRYDNLTLRLANDVVDMSKCLYFLMHQSEGDMELKEAMRKARVEPSMTSIYERCNGQRGMLEYQQHMCALKERHATQPGTIGATQST